MLLDVLIPSNWQLSKLQPLLESISAQSLQPDRILILIHKNLKKEEQDTLLYFLQRSVHPGLADKITLITNLTAEYESGHGVGHDRNVLVSHAKAKYIYMIDHDNIFKEHMFQDTASQWMKIKEEWWVEALVSPTILWRKTVTIQSQWITWFRYFLPKYIYGKMELQPWQEVLMVGANSLFGLREVFEQHPFDHRMMCCYEDIDMTRRVSLSWTPVMVLNKVEINHMETKKSRLGELFLATRASAYERARNRIWFVKNHATTWQKIQYFWIWLWWQTFWFLLMVLIYGGKERFALMQAVVSGTRDGLIS